ncbi:MAG TPA: hypothetical protein VJR03_03340 [Nitrospira sp.]|nr:hypothetical protein [Nitrospira sp.]
MASKHDILRQYGQYSVELAQRLKDGVKLNLEEQMFVENHLLIVQLALAMSKHNKTRAPVPVRGE